MFPKGTEVVVSVGCNLFSSNWPCYKGMVSNYMDLLLMVCLCICFQTWTKDSSYLYRLQGFKKQYMYICIFVYTYYSVYMFWYFYRYIHVYYVYMYIYVYLHPYTVHFFCSLAFCLKKILQFDNNFHVSTHQGTQALSLEQMQATFVAPWKPGKMGGSMGTSTILWMVEEIPFPSTVWMYKTLWKMG